MTNAERNAALLRCPPNMISTEILTDLCNNWTDGYDTLLDGIRDLIAAKEFDPYADQTFTCPCGYTSSNSYTVSVINELHLKCPVCGRDATAQMFTGGAES